MNSKTPRSDAAGGYVNSRGDFCLDKLVKWQVSITFARKLETELNEAREEIAKLKTVAAETAQTTDSPAVIQERLVRQSSVDHAQIIRTWEDSLKDMQSRIRVEQKKAEEATIKVNALQEEYWRLEGRLDVAKELVRKQSLLNS